MKKKYRRIIEGMLLLCLLSFFIFSNRESAAVEVENLDVTKNNTQATYNQCADHVVDIELAAGDDCKINGHNYSSCIKITIKDGENSKYFARVNRYSIDNIRLNDIGAVQEWPELDETVAPKNNAIVFGYNSDVAQNVEINVVYTNGNVKCSTESTAEIAGKDQTQGTTNTNYDGICKYYRENVWPSDKPELISMLEANNVSESDFKTYASSTYYKYCYQGTVQVNYDTETVARGIAAAINEKKRENNSTSNSLKGPSNTNVITYNLSDDKDGTKYENFQKVLTNANAGTNENGETKESRTCSAIFPDTYTPTSNSGEYQYLNSNTYYAIKSEKTTDSYNYGWTCEKICEETITVEYGPPVATKAGLCFEYKVKATSTVNCTSKTNATPPDTNDYICNPTPSCITNGESFTSAGPNDDFDNCVKACDNGKYTQECIDKCYSQEYSTVSNTKLSYENKKNNVSNLISTKTNLQVPMSNIVIQKPTTDVPYDDEKYFYLLRILGEAVNGYKSVGAKIVGDNIIVDGDTTYSDYTVSGLAEFIRTGSSKYGASVFGYYYIKDEKIVWQPGSYYWDSGWKEGTLYLTKYARYYFSTNEEAGKTLNRDYNICNNLSSLEGVSCGKWRNTAQKYGLYIPDEGTGFAYDYGSRCQNMHDIEYDGGKISNYHCDQTTGGTVSKWTWCARSCKYTGCKTTDNLNFENSSSEYSDKLSRYNNFVGTCQAAATCKTETAEFTISVNYKTKEQTTTTKQIYTSTLKKTNGSNSFIVNPGSNANTGTIDIITDRDGCYGELQSTNWYMTEWSFPGTWKNMKTGEISYKPITDDTWKMEEDKFCPNYNFANVNVGWFYYGFTGKRTTVKEGTDEYGNTKLEKEKENATDAELKSKVEDYNIIATLSDFGHFGWNIDVNCFYSLWEAKTTDKIIGDPPYYTVRTVDNSNLFPSTEGTTRKIGFNWTSAAYNDKNSVYTVDPEKLIIDIQTKGDSIYSNDEELDYEFILDRTTINAIRADTATLESYADFNGEYKESSIGPSVYKSSLISKYAINNGIPGKNND